MPCYLPLTSNDYTHLFYIFDDEECDCTKESSLNEQRFFFVF